METTPTAVSPAPTSPAAIGVRFGLFIGIVGILFDFLVRMAGLNSLSYVILMGSIGLVIGVVGIVLAHRAYKQANAMQMTYGQGVLISVIALLISSLLSVTFNYLYLHYVDPEFVGRMKEQMTEFMERNGVPDDKIAESVSRMDEMNPPLGKALLKGVLNGTVGGAILGLIISAFTKRKAADFE